jgi:2-dehydro-3-deoxyphosphooctonate aldolase (KDO 8-P synthase)
VRAVDTLFQPGGGFFAIAGPCVIESEAMVREVAAHLKGVSERLGIPIVFKSSYLKDNRTSADSFRGPGLEAGLRVLAGVRDSFGLPVLSDVHGVHELSLAAEWLDVIQIPAFLCRQSQLLESAAATGRPLNIKKGQFLAPGSVRFIVEKARRAGARAVAVTERGACFGYGDLVVDPRTFQILSEIPVTSVFDATHSLQKPGGGVTGGERRFARTVARAAIAAGADGIFLETHPDPDGAQSDRLTQLPLAEVESFLAEMQALRAHVAGLAGRDRGRT